MSHPDRRLVTLPPKQIESDSIGSVGGEVDRKFLEEGTPDALTLAIGQVHAAECALRGGLLELVSAFDRRELWREDGATSMVSWLTARLSISNATAAEIVWVAARAESLPAARSAFSSSRISWDQLSSVTRFATPATDQAITESATGLSAAELARTARRHRQATESSERRSRRYLRWWWESDRDFLRLDGRLPGDDGALVAKALERLALQTPPNPTTGMFDHFQSRCADALVELAAAHIADDADPDRATIVVHVGADTLLDGAGVGEIEDGPAISVETARRLACDARLQVVVDGPDGRPIGVGRVTRRIPPWLERMVRHRDQGCRFPGCGRRRWLHSHHVAAWYKDGGPTDLVNLVACAATTTTSSTKEVGGSRVHRRECSPSSDPTVGPIGPVPTSCWTRSNAASSTRYSMILLPTTPSFGAVRPWCTVFPDGALEVDPTRVPLLALLALGLAPLLHLGQLGLGGHLLGEEARLDAVKEALQPTDQLSLGDS